MSNPENRLYSEEHAWVTLEDNIATVGLTPYAKEALGEVVFIDLPPAGTTVRVGEPLGELESTKSVTDLYSPVSGEVVDRNENVRAGVHIINEDPWGAWMVKIRLADGANLDHLLDAGKYTELTENS